jgi:hypothetical protein
MAGSMGFLWHRDVSSWLDQGSRALGEDLAILRFEELRENPRGALEFVLPFLGFEVDPCRIDFALKETKLSNLRKVEKARWKELGVTGVTGTDRSFYRGGVSGQWEELFSEDQMRTFLEQAGSTLFRLGYTDQMDVGLL